MAGKRKIGAKPKLTPQVQAKIVLAIRNGNYIEVAAAYAGIHKTQFYRWMARGESESSGMYRDFRNAVKDAESAAEVETVALVRAASRESWQAGMTWLERKFPERWGRKDRLEHTGQDGGPIRIVTAEELTDDDLAAIAAGKK